MHMSSSRWPQPSSRTLRDRRQEQAPIAYLPSYLSSQCDRCSRSTDFCSDGIAFSTGDGTLVELTFHTDWMRYDCYVDLSGAVLGAFRKNWLPFLGGLVLVVGLSALRLSALVNGIGTALYAFAAGALAISAMVLPGISGSSLLMSCGLYLPVIAAMKDLLHFQFGQFWLLAAVGLGVLAGFAIAPHCIRGWMRKAPGAVTYAVLGMMLGSLYAIVVGPTTLKVSQYAMTISDFHLLWFALGIAVMLGLEALKRRVQKAPAH